MPKKGFKHTKETREKMRKAAYTRDNGPRLAAIPKGINHWAWKDKPAKGTVHRRLDRWYGSAKKFFCVDCGKRAHDWSYAEKTGYGINIFLYLPRCRSCHLKHDQNWQGDKRIK